MAWGKQKAWGSNQWESWKKTQDWSPDRKERKAKGDNTKALEAEVEQFATELRQEFAPPQEPPKPVNRNLDQDFDHADKMKKMPSSSSQPSI